MTQLAMKALPMTLAYKCVEAACAGRPQGFRGLSSGWAKDEMRKLEERICMLFDRKPGRTSQGFVEVEITTDSQGQKRLIIDNERGYFDHVIAL